YSRKQGFFPVLKKMDFLGNSFLGVFCAASDKVAFVPEQADEHFIEELKNTFSVEVERLSIDGSPLLGALLVMNSKGAVVADFAQSEDIGRISSYLPVERVKDPLNAVGNNLLVNDNGALANPEMDQESLDLISSVLKVPVTKGVIGGVVTVGAAAVTNMKGVLCHPKSTDEERAMVQKILGVPVGIGTANFGSPLVGAAMVCNTKGGVAGTKTTGVEMHRIEDILGLY
ncbi:MAG: translation initiation factor IF-6, partial [Candidatus Thermoplasmatota archaeon]|nr:translation initiation factor IF-6 [Candidatus Thermoplasmatota archaeon]